jgi:hypothetical protein
MATRTNLGRSANDTPRAKTREAILEPDVSRRELSPDSVSVPVELVVHPGRARSERRRTEQVQVGEL